jgi:hypothetical protein
MFTIKLTVSGRERIIGADSFTIINEDKHGYLKGVTLHRVNPADDEVYYVGTATATTSYADEFKTYANAFIENAAGKTVAVVRPDMYPPESLPAMPLGESYGMVDAVRNQNAVPVPTA